jgi:transglutaminase-like putative cysteine protease
MGELSKKRTSRTAKKKELFLKGLRADGRIICACEALGIPRTSVYEWREKDPAFAAEWDAAVEAMTENLEQEAYRRAYEGVSKPVYQGKELVGHVQEYSDTLTIFLLKARKPNIYTQVQKVAPTDPSGENPYMTASTEELRELAAKIANGITNPKE